MSPLRNPPWKSSFGPGASGERIGDNGELANKRHHCSGLPGLGVSGCRARTVRPMPRPQISASQGLAMSLVGEGMEGARLTQIQGSTPSPCVPLLPALYFRLPSAFVFRSRIHTGRYQPTSRALPPPPVVVVLCPWAARCLGSTALLSPSAG